jgi:hypothetical protein
MEVTLFVIDVVLAFAPFVVLVFGPERRAERPVTPRRRSASGLAAYRRAKRKAAPEVVGLSLNPPTPEVGGGTSAPVRLRPARRPMRPRFHRPPRGHSRGTRRTGA